LREERVNAKWTSPDQVRRTPENDDEIGDAEARGSRDRGWTAPAPNCA
jgi:hypothetical protein